VAGPADRRLLPPRCLHAETPTGGADGRTAQGMHDPVRRQCIISSMRGEKVLEWRSDRYLQLTSSCLSFRGYRAEKVGPADMDEPCLWPSEQTSCSRTTVCLWTEPVPLERKMVSPCLSQLCSASPFSDWRLIWSSAPTRRSCISRLAASDPAVAIRREKSGMSQCMVSEAAPASF
jgi:hypothetical protein